MIIPLELKPPSMGKTVPLIYEDPGKVKNNAADKIANHRVNDVEINFGTYTNNWNGYKESITLNSILEDTSNINYT